MSDEVKIYNAPRKPPRRRLLAAICVCLAFALGGYFLGYARGRSAAQVPSPAALVETSDPFLPANAPSAVAMDPKLAQLLNQNLLAWLPFDNDLLDHSSHKQRVHAMGGVSAKQGAARFDGSSWLELPHIPLNRRQFSVAFWINPSVDTGGYGLVMQIGAFRPGNYLHIMVREGARPYLGFYSNDLLPAADHVVRLNTWTHLVFQYAGGKQRIFRNGRLIAERNTSEYEGEHGPTLIGRGEAEFKFCDSHFNGWMRDLRIYDSVLTDVQIQALAGQIPVSAAPTKRKKAEPAF